MYTRQLSKSQRVITPEGPASLEVHRLGPHPILVHFMDRMTLPGIVSSCLGLGKETLLDHAKTLALLVQNIILSPAPLYRIADWAAGIDPSALGLSETQKQALNDDRVARSLEALASSRARNVFFRIALHVIKEFEINTQRVHHDTTTVTFHGRYDTSVGEPKITYGHNKDHRPDLKQLVFGLNISADGAVPLSHEVFSGNRTDDTIHVGNVEHLRHLLRRDDFVYVADSKLCTKKNLGHITGYGGKFVTVLPRTYAEDKTFREELRQGKHRLRWRKILEQPAKRHPATMDVYWTLSGGPSTTQDGHRLIWYRSSQKMSNDSVAREASIEKTLALLSDLSTKVNKGKYRERSAIVAEIKNILRKYSCENFVDVQMSSKLERTAIAEKRGRPKKDDPRQWVTKRLFRLDVKRNKAVIEAEARTDGVFPLVTNLTESAQSKRDVLLIYKYQPYLEKRHALFKGELGIAPVYLKKPSRVVGLIHATFLAMTLDALIERTVRRNMAKMGIASLPILPEGRETKTPTTARILETFADLSWYDFKRGEEIVSFPIKLTATQKQLLQLLDMDMSAYR